MAKIVVVDDAPEVVALISSTLAAAGHAVMHWDADSGFERRLTADRPDLILLDIVMPTRDGYDLLRSIKRNPDTQSIPVVLVSKKGAVSDREWGRMQGADDYLVKPFTNEQLSTVVAKFVRW